MRRQVFLPIIHKNPYLCFPEAIGWYHSDEHHQVTRIQNELNHFNLHVVLSGKGYVQTQTTKYILQQGDAFLYFPSERQHYYSDLENPWEIIWLHFSGKVFKKATGMSPSNFIQLCRLQKSKQLLVERFDWTVKQIAIESGYPSISYFGKIFLENEGVTPTMYRERYMI